MTTSTLEEVLRAGHRQALVSRACDRDEVVARIERAARRHLRRLHVTQWVLAWLMLLDPTAPAAAWSTPWAIARIVGMTAALAFAAVRWRLVARCPLGEVLTAIGRARTAIPVLVGAWSLMPSLRLLEALRLASGWRLLLPFLATAGVWWTVSTLMRGGERGDGPSER